MGRGLAFLGLGQPERSLKDFDCALTLFADEEDHGSKVAAPVKVARGRVYTALRQPDRAFRAFETALNPRPNYEAA